MGLQREKKEREEEIEDLSWVEILIQRKGETEESLVEGERKHE